MEINVDVRLKGIESAIVSAPFDKALKTLKNNGYRIISLPENAILRIQQGENSSISREGNNTREGIIHFPRENPKLVRNSPILYSAKEATQTHRKGGEFFLTKEQVEQSLVDSFDFPIEDIEIPTNRFDSDALAVFAFGGERQARQYGEFLRNAGINRIPIWVISINHTNKQSQPFVRPMWFGDLGHGSVFNTVDGTFYSTRLRGIK